MVLRSYKVRRGYYRIGDIVHVNVPNKYNPIHFTHANKSLNRYLHFYQIASNIIRLKDSIRKRVYNKSSIYNYLQNIEDSLNVVELFFRRYPTAKLYCDNTYFDRQTFLNLSNISEQLVFRYLDYYNSYKSYRRFPKV